MTASDGEAPSLTSVLGAGRDFFRDVVGADDPGLLYSFLRAMPKGANLHVHLSGCGQPADWLRLARLHHGAYRVEATPCVAHTPHSQQAPRLLRTSEHRTLPPCCRPGFVALEAADANTVERWAASVFLSRPDPDIFFQRIVPQLKAVRKHPAVISELLVAARREAAAEGVSYLEVTTGPFGYVGTDGEPVPPDAMVDRYRRCLAGAGGSAVPTRLVLNVSRTAVDVEARLQASVAFAAAHADVWVGVQLSGEEGRDVVPLRELRRLYEALADRYPQVRFAVHAGEGFGARYSLVPAVELPVSRISHGLQAVHEPHVLRRLCERGIPVEMSPVSNFMLGKTPLESHPLPTLLRQGVPVCLGTDNPGLWGSCLSDEFFVAVRYLGLSWPDLVNLTVTSLRAAFLPAATRERLLAAHLQRLGSFLRHWRQLGAVEPAVPSRFAQAFLGVPGSSEASEPRVGAVPRRADADGERGG